MAFDSFGYVDLGMIPPALVERVEVITGGASAVYGSDAIAGVVNFIMKKDFEGVHFDGQYGVSEKSDGDTYDFSTTMGFNLDNDRGNIVVNASYTEKQAVCQGAREFSEFSLASEDFGPGGSATTPQGTILLEDFYQFNASGELVPLFEPFNFNPFNLLQAPQKKWTATALGHYRITDSIEAFGRVSFANNQVTTIIAPTGTFFFPFEINLDNPFLTPQAAALLGTVDGDDGAVDGRSTVSFGRRLTELGTRDSIYENTAYQFVGGFRGDLADDYQWELFAQYGHTSRTITYANDVSFSRAQQALLAVDDGSGNIVCEDQSGGCAPANLFGEGNLSEEAAQFIRLDLQQIDATSQFVTGGQITGDLPFTVPSAVSPGGFAVGYEYRRESSETRPDDNLVSGNSIGFGSSTPIDAKYDVLEGFAELLVPVVEDAPFVHSLSLELGIRYADYSSKVGSVKNSFTNTSYKMGGEWAPVESLRFRGLYQRAVRAPNINEIGLPKTPSTGDANNDYCAGTNPVGDAALTALCIATGVPAGNIGSVAGPIAGQINNFLGGNPNLQPEKSDTYTFGAVFTPESVPDLTLSVDYYSIKVNDAIVNVTEQATLDACYLYERDPNGFFCQRIARNPLNGALIGGTETGVDVSKVNAGAYKTQGIDFSARYGFDLGNDWGYLNLAILGTRVIHSYKQDAPLFARNDCAGLVGDICERPDPKWRWTQTTTWNYRDLTLQLRWQYIGKLTHDSIKLQGNDPANFVVPVIGDRHYFDLSASYEVNEHFTLRGGVNNLLDSKPPVVGNDYGGTAENSGNTYPATYDPLGRAFFFGATARF
ncbi:MAG: TonB-dependent receptor [Alphaproteobacteria bacterium]|nr:MAG: TonB-dependent receptor [Alphaproteobacteria bacterium]